MQRKNHIRELKKIRQSFIRKKNVSEKIRGPHEKRKEVRLPGGAGGGTDAENGEGETFMTGASTKS